MRNKNTNMRNKIILLVPPITKINKVLNSIRMDAQLVKYERERGKCDGSNVSGLV